LEAGRGGEGAGGGRLLVFLLLCEALAEDSGDDWGAGSACRRGRHGDGP
jgi:hypothetical protein